MESMDVANSENSNDDVYDVIQENETIVFKCRLCEMKFDGLKGFKQHFGKKHRKRKLTMENNTEKKTKTLEESRLSESFLKEWDDKEVAAASTQINPMEDILKKYDFIIDEKEKVSEATLRDFESSVHEEDFMEGGDGQDTQVEENVDTKDVKQELVIANAKIESLNLEKEVKEAQIVELKQNMLNLQEQLETKNDLNLAAQGKIASLEMELNVKSSKLVDTESENQRYVAIMKKMHAELKAMDDKGRKVANHDKLVKDNETMKEKLKKKTDEVKERSKEVEKLRETEKRNVKNMADMEQKLSAEANLRAKAETDNIRAVKFNEHLQELCNLKGVLKDNATTKPLGEPDEKDDTGKEFARKKVTPGSIDEKCRNFENSNCRWGSECKRIHPTTTCRFFARMGECQKGVECPDLHRPAQKVKDCTFWMKGGCHFSDIKCFGKHDPSKQGIIREEEARNRRRSSFSNEDSGMQTRRSASFSENRSPVKYRNVTDEDINRIVNEKLMIERNHFLSRGQEAQILPAQMPSSGQTMYQPQQNQPGYHNQINQQTIPPNWMENAQNSGNHGLNTPPTRNHSNRMENSWNHQNQESFYQPGPTRMDTAQSGQPAAWSKGPSSPVEVATSAQNQAPQNNFWKPGAGFSRR